MIFLLGFYFGGAVATIGFSLIGMIYGQPLTISPWLVVWNIIIWPVSMYRCLVEGPP